MSAESGGAKSSDGSTNSTEPCDVPNMTNPVQEAEHEVANSCSKLAVNPSESLSRFSAIYQSPQSASVTASLLSGRLSTTLSATASLARHVREDEQEHQNEDATQYTRQSSSEDGSQDTLSAGDRDAHTPQPPSSEEDNLTTPVQAEIGSDEETLEMVVTKDVSTASLISTYCLIQKINATSKDIDEAETTPIFAMDDDEEQSHDQARANSNSSSEFTGRLSLTFGTEEPMNHLPNPPASAKIAGSSANGNPDRKVEDKSHTPVDTAPNPVEHIDKVDEHRESNNYRVANTGGVTQGIPRERLCCSISNTCPTSQVDYILPKFNVGDAKVECTLHPQGKDQDYTDNKVTVTSIVHLPKYARNSDSLYAQPNCAIKFTTKVYKGSVQKSNLLGQANATRKLREDERQSLMVHMTVHNVATQKDIIYSRCSEKIFTRVTAELLY